MKFLFKTKKGAAEKIAVIHQAAFRILVFNRVETLDVEIGKQLPVNVTVFVPWYTDVNTDVLELTVISEESGETYGRICVLIFLQPQSHLIYLLSKGLLSSRIALGICRV